MTPRQLFLHHQGQTSPFPLLLEVERAEGLYLYTPEGQPILDLISGIGVSNVGHRHPKVLQAIQRQLDKHLHVMVYGELVQSPQVQLAAALAQTLPAPLASAFFVNSGSEAVEGALKLAKRYTGRTELVGMRRAYHGSTHGALSLSGGELFKGAFRPLLPDVRQLAFNCEYCLGQISERTAAVIVETVQGEAGVQAPQREYLQALRQRCNETGALLILDEIQCGFGRTGTLWAFEQYGIQPDILVCAKGMGGGMPIGAFISSPEIMRTLTHDPILGHITTFGGHPVSCAAALATLQVIQEEKLLQGVAAKAQHLRERLAAHPAVLEVRNAGLLMAVEFGSFARLKPIIDRAIELGLLTDWFLFCDTAMRIAPPLTITHEQIDEACDRLFAAIDAAPYATDWEKAAPGLS